MTKPPVIHGLPNIYKEDGEKRKFLNRGAKLFYQKFGYKVFCTFSFNKIVKVKNENTFWDPILNIINEEIQNRNENDRSSIIRNRKNLMRKEITAIQVYKPNDKISLEWGFGGFFPVPPKIAIEELKKILEKKESKIESFSGSFAEKWLIIYESSQRGAWRSNLEELINIKLPSTFDKVYYFSLSEIIYELK